MKYTEVVKLRTEDEKRHAGEELYKYLRQEDKREIRAFTEDVEDEVIGSLLVSDECFAGYGYKEGQRELVCCFGIRELKEIDGRLIWCLGTDKMDTYTYAFARQSLKIVRTWAKEYGRLYNQVGAYNEKAKKWLEWCGAKLYPENVIGDELFHPFIIEGGENNV